MVFLPISRYTDITVKLSADPKPMLIK